MVRLKKGQESFTPVDGPDKGFTFERGVEYGKAPKGYEDRFEEVKILAPVEPKTKSRKGNK